MWLLLSLLLILTLYGRFSVGYFGQALQVLGVFVGEVLFESPPAPVIAHRGGNVDTRFRSESLKLLDSRHGDVRGALPCDVDERAWKLPPPF